MRASLHTATLPHFAEEETEEGCGTGCSEWPRLLSWKVVYLACVPAPTCGTWRRAQLAHSNDESKLRSGTLTVLISVRRFEKR